MTREAVFLKVFWNIKDTKITRTQKKQTSNSILVVRCAFNWFSMCGPHFVFSFRFETAFF